MELNKPSHTPNVTMQSAPKVLLRTLLVLGRVSNLPTVWSNCLAAWLLGGSGHWERFLLVTSGATLLYTGGMFLNDAFDAPFDRKHRPERPIPSGRISLRAVWISSIVLLVCGWLMLVPLGTWPTVVAFMLMGAIVLYNWLHKQSRGAALLMAACRFLLYLLVASAAQGGTRPDLWWGASALALYIYAISSLARDEYARVSRTGWWGGLLLVPVVMALARGPSPMPLLPWVLASVGATWIIFCLRKRKGFAHGVAGLLAGIVLVDWLAVAGREQTPDLVFVALFCSALILQRIAPAT